MRRGTIEKSAAESLESALLAGSNSLLSPPVQQLTKFRVRDKAFLMTPRQLSQRQRKTLRMKRSPASPREQTKTACVFEAMKLASTPLGKNQCSYGMRRMLTAKGYERKRHCARRPDGSSLRFEICVLFVIGRSPTQKILCHK